MRLFAFHAADYSFCILVNTTGFRNFLQRLIIGLNRHELADNRTNQSGKYIRDDLPLCFAQPFDRKAKRFIDSKRISLAL
ncbi:hypothetical protein [Propionispora sp. 2/2-37]|uniref:hypothetical protein n=1 Tax=Propionispora sp. 2/2-37 TaxID=1677858 RepID=UPI0012E25100|nr:hypothetical protein [Propionispora sp. 2/2-37]